MTERISHTEAHEVWSEEQLALFHQMGARERLNAVKSGALEHWTEAARAAALDLLGDNEIRPASSPTPQTVRFEHARHPLPPQAVLAARMDRFMVAASVGWTAIMIAAAANAYGLD